MSAPTDPSPVPDQVGQAGQAGEAPSATGTVAGLSPDQTEFGPLEDPPRVDGAEIIGGPADDELGEGGPSDTVAPSSDHQDPADLPDEALQTHGAVSIPLEDQPGFVLPPILMERADHIGQETASIAAEITEIERANEAAEPVVPTESVEASADSKESK
jgi:hypothetical protein